MRAMAPALVFEELLAARRSLRIAVVTETWPPEVNGVAKTAARFVEALRGRGHDIQLVRPRQGANDRASDESADARHDDPRYLPRRACPPKPRSCGWNSPARRGTSHRGPARLVGLQARAAQLPVCSDFRTNFHAYSRHYGMGWLHKPIMAYLRKFHNRTAATPVPTEAMRADLAALVQRLRVIGRRRHQAVDPARCDQRFAPQRLGRKMVPCVGRLAAEKTCRRSAPARRRQRQAARGCCSSATALRGASCRRACCRRCLPARAPERTLPRITRARTSSSSRALPRPTAT
jgi:hypothetical protein